MLNPLSFVPGFMPAAETVKVIIYTVIVVVILSLFGTTVYYKKSYEGALTEITSLKDSVANLQTGIAAQNKSIQDAADAAKKKQDEIKAALDAANVKAKKSQDYANYLLSQTSKSGNVCNDTNDLINEYLKTKKGATK